MAGIGFALRRLSRHDNLLGAVQAFGHAAVASSGPWIFTVLCLAAVTILAVSAVGFALIETFRVIVMYNFAVSLVLTGGLVRLVTRLLADQLYERTVDKATGLLFGALVVSLLVQAPFVVGFYLGVTDLPLAVAVAAILNYFVIATLWLVAVFLTALKVYLAVSASFLLGLAVAFGGSVVGLQLGGLPAMLLGFTLGLAVIVFMIVGRIFAEYPERIVQPFAFLRRLGPYRMIFAAGLAYNLAIWIDKFVMWLAPERQAVGQGLVYYGVYDSAMFLAFLTTIPALAIFVVGVETRFYENYLRFYRDIQDKATYDAIRVNHREMVRDLASSFRNILVIQAAISALFVFLAPRILELLGMDFVGLGIFRFGIAGAFFHTMLLLVTIILSYYDLRAQVLWIYLLFLATNAGFTYVFLGMGFEYYGYGYFLASLVTFVVAAVIAVREVARIPYLTFVQDHAA